MTRRQFLLTLVAMIVGFFAGLLRLPAPAPAVVELEEVLVPTFEIATNPSIRMSDIKARRFDIIDRCQVNARAAIAAEEDANIFRTLRESVSSGQSMTRASKCVA